MCGIAGLIGWSGTDNELIDLRIKSNLHFITVVQIVEAIWSSRKR